MLHGAQTQSTRPPETPTFPPDIAAKQPQSNSKPPKRADFDVLARRGDFYYATQRYRAAAYWYEEALSRESERRFQSTSRVTFKLTKSLELAGKFSDAQKYYLSYLSMEPQGEFAAEARKSLQRLTPQTQP